MNDLYRCIPKQLKIAGKRVKIEFLETREENWGEFHSDDSIIKVYPHGTPEQVLDTLLHEILHAVYAYWNIYEEDDEERTVHTMASALQSLFTDNAHLLTCVKRYTTAIRKKHTT